MTTKTDEERAAEWEARIDISEPIAELCQRLGIAYNLTARIDFRPDIVTAEVYLPNENGKPYIDTAIGDAAMETLHFEVRS